MMFLLISLSFFIIFVLIIFLLDYLLFGKPKRKSAKVDLFKLLGVPRSSNLKTNVKPGFWTLKMRVINCDTYAEHNMTLYFLNWDEATSFRNLIEKAGGTGVDLDGYARFSILNTKIERLIPQES